MPKFSCYHIRGNVLFPITFPCFNQTEPKLRKSSLHRGAYVFILKVQKNFVFFFEAGMALELSHVTKNKYKSYQSKTRINLLFGLEIWFLRT